MADYFELTLENAVTFKILKIEMAWDWRSSSFVRKSVLVDHQIGTLPPEQIRLRETDEIRSTVDLRMDTIDWVPTWRK